MAKKRKRNAKAARSQKGSRRRSSTPWRKKGQKKKQLTKKRLQRFIKTKIRYLIKHEGMPQKRAIAVAYSYARKRWPRNKLTRKRVLLRRPQ